uniref:hypothetical protein n=1 Tax=Xenorhabdus sp. PB61.4 TaxID=2788940 RepID=UPI001E58D248
DEHDSILFSVILRFGNKNFANLGSSFFDTPTILTSYLGEEYGFLSSFMRSLISTTFHLEKMRVTDFG